MTAIVLHQWEISPFCGKVRKILDAKGLAYDVVDYNGLLARKAARLSRVGKLPVLVHGEERIQDSSRIAAYLEKHYPEPPLFPTEATARAQAHFWEDWADEALYWIEVYLRFHDPEAWTSSVRLLCRGRPAYERFIFARLTGFIYRRRLAAQGLGRQSYKNVVTLLTSHLDALEVMLGDRAWLLGDHRSIADLAVAAQLDEIVRTSSLRTAILERPNLSGWLTRSSQLVQRTGHQAP